jgi:hypothetical protein
MAFNQQNAQECYDRPTHSMAFGTSKELPMPDRFSQKTERRNEKKGYGIMNDKDRLLSIKLIHTVIWLFFNVVIFYLLYAVIVNKIDLWVWICIGLVLLEGIVLLLFKWFCPLTVIARRHSDSTRDNFDIFLPNWLAKYNKLIYTSIFAIAVVILIYIIFQS